MRRVDLRSPAVQGAMVAGASASAQLLTAALYVVGARGAAPGDFGVTVTGVALGLAAAGIFDFGTASLWVRDLAAGSAPRVLSPRAITKVLVIVMISLLAISASPIVGWTWLLVAGCITPGQVLMQTVQVPLRARALIGRVVMVQVGERVIAGVVMIILISAGTGSHTALWIALASGTASAALFAQAVTPRTVRFGSHHGWWANPWKGSISFGLSGVANSLQALDAAVLGWVAGPAAGGVYGAVSRWTQPLGLPVNAFAVTALPHMARARSHLQAARSVASGTWLLALALGGALFVAVAGGWLAPLLLGPEYEESGAVLQLLALATIPGILTQPLFVFLQARGAERVAARWFLGAVSLQLTLLVALAPALQAAGAAVALGMMQIVLLVGLISSVVKLMRGDNSLVSQGPGVGASSDHR